MNEWKNVHISFFFSFSTALQKLQNTYMFPIRQYVQFGGWKLFLMLSFLHISECLNSCICMSPSVVVSVKRWISKSYSHCWKGFKYAKDARPGWLFLKNSGQFNCSGQTWDYITITKQTKKQCKLLNGVHFYKFNYYFVLWNICTLLGKISYSGWYKIK